MDGLIYFLGSMALAATIYGIIVIFQNKEVFFPAKKHSH